MSFHFYFSDRLVKNTAHLVVQVSPPCEYQELAPSLECELRDDQSEHGSIIKRHFLTTCLSAFSILSKNPYLPQMRLLSLPTETHTRICNSLLVKGS